MKQYPKFVYAEDSEPVRIDFSAIPASDIQIGCSVLAASIRRALRDPEKHADFERWKTERAAEGRSGT